MSRRATRRAATMTAAVGAFLLSVGTLAGANTTTQTLPFSQNWTNTGLVSVSDDWNSVPGIMGYRGDNLAAAGANPQTVTADGSGTPVDVNANLTNPSQNGNPPSGVSEFQITDPTIGLRGSATSVAPHIVMNLNTTGVYGVNVAYVLRDIDASARNSTSQFALQYRVGGTGAYTDVPAGYVADATTVSAATQTTNVSALLPAAADNKALVQVRVITVHSGGNDENVGIDNMSVTDTNLSPVNTVPGAQSTNEDAARLFNAANGNKVSVADADASSVQTRLQVTNGTLTLGATAGISFGAGANGTNDMTFTGSQANVNAALDGLRFDPNANYNGPAQLTVTTNDLGNTGTGGAKTDTDTVAIAVNAVNDAPTVSDITPKTTTEDAATADVPFTVDDVETAAGSLAVAGSSSDQTLVPDANITLAGSGANRTVKVTPAANRSGTATISVTVADGVGPGSLSATDTFVLTVNEVNDPVTATGDTKSVAEDGTLVFPASDLTANDSAGPNEGAQTLSVAGVSGATHGSVDLSSGQITYTPDADYNGPAQFHYNTCDSGTPQECATSTVDVAVTAVNDAPTVSGIGDEETDEDTATAAIPFTVDDVEAGAANVAASATSSDQTLVPDSNIGVGPASPTGGERTVTVTPAANKSGSATITVTAADGAGPGSAATTETFELTVDAVNDVPVAADETLTTDEDESGEVAFSAADLEGDALQYDVVDGPQHGSLSGSGDARTYTPDADYNGSDSFTYRASDPNAGNTATVDVTVEPVNDAPVAEGESYATDEDQRLTIGADEGVLDNDTDVDADDLTATVDGGPDHGELDLAADGSFEYTPDADYNGADAFAYTVSDGTDTDTVTAQISVGPVNDAPVAQEDTYGVDEDATLTVNAADGVLDNDTDVDGDGLAAAVEIGPEHGELDVAPDGSFGYTPDADYNGSDSFSYAVGDGTIEDTATVDVTVRPVNDAPVAQDDSMSIDEDAAPVSIDLGDLVSDRETGDADLSYAVVAGPTPAQGVLSGSGPTLDFDSAADFNGSVAIDYKVADRGDPDDCGTAGPGCDASRESGIGTVTVDVTAVNDAPALDLNGGAAGTGYAATFEEDGPAVSVVDEDALSVGDVDDTDMDSATVEISNPLDANAESLAVDTAGTDIDDEYDAQSGELLLTGAAPKADYEQVLRTVTYRNTSQDPSTADRDVTFVVGDGTGPSNAATSEVSIDASNDAPTISDVTDKAVDEGTTAGPYSFTVDDAETGSTALDVSGSSDDQALVPDQNIEIGPASPTNGNRTVTITPAPDRFGTAGISLTVSDGAGAESLSTTDTFVLTVRDTTPPAAPTLDLDAGSDTGTSDSDEVTRHDNPSFSGDAETGSTVEIFKGATLLGSVTANAGRWDYTVPAGSTFSDGDHYIRVRATDAAGNRSGFGTLGITVDTQDPETSVTDGPAALVRGTSAEFSFHPSQTNSTFECSLDGGAFEACSSPKTYGGLAAGLHDFEVYATDRAGNADDTPSRRTWRIDTTAPTVALTAPAEDAKLRGTVSLEAAADDAHDIRRVEFLVDGASVDTDASAPYNFAWDTTSVADGTHTLRAWTVDGAGNEAASSPVSVTVDNTAPETRIDEAPAAQTGDTSAVFEFSSDEPDSTFECKLDAGGYEACLSSKRYENLDEGDHTFRVRATDATGNVDASPAEHAFTVDTSAPPEPVVGSPEDGSFSGSDAVTFSGTGAPGTTVRVSEGAQLVGSTTVDGDGNWTITIDGVADGEHTYAIESFDAAGNASDGRSVTVTVETDAPAVTVVDPAAGATGVAAGANVQARFSKDIAGSTLAGNFTLKKEGATDAMAAEVGYDADTKTATLDPGADLQYSTTYVAAVRDGADGVEDRAGNPLEAGRTWSFTTGEAPDTTAPDAPEVTAPADGSYDNDGELSVSGTAEPDSTVELFEGTQSRGTDRADENGGWSIDLAGVSEGQHLYRANATDAANNTSGFSQVISVTVDKTEDDTSITAGPSGSTSGAAATFRFESGEPGGTFECRLDGGQFEACASPESYTSLPEGQHTFRVRSIDRAGNVESAPAERTWTVDGSAPSLEITGGPTGRSSAKDATFGLVAEAGSSLQCRLDGGQFEACASSKSYANLSEGQHTLTARATDGAGNVSEASRTWTVDSTAPVIVKVTPGKKATTSSPITVQFDEDMDAASFAATGAFALKKGKKAVVIKAVTYDPSTRTVTFAPAKLSKGSYTATLTKVKDLAGNTTAANKVWKFKVK